MKLEDLKKDYDSDDEKGTLRHAVYQGVMNP